MSGVENCLQAPKRASDIFVAEAPPPERLQSAGFKARILLQAKWLVLVKAGGIRRGKGVCLNHSKSAYHIVGAATPF